MNFNIIKKFPRRPSDVLNRDETRGIPNQTIARPAIRSTSELIQPMMPDTSAQMDLPSINPRQAKRPVMQAIPDTSVQMNLPDINPPRAKRPVLLPGGEILEKTLAAPSPAFSVGADISPTPKIYPQRPLRKSEETKEKIDYLEGSPLVDEDKGNWKAQGWDIAKNALKGFLQGVGNSGGNLLGGLGGAIGGAGVQLADPTADEKYARQRKLAELYGIYDNQYKIETDQEKIRREQANIGNIAADNQRDRDRLALQEKQYDLNVERVLDKRDFDEWRIKNGDAKLSDYQAYNQWRMGLGDKKQASQEEYYKWKREADKANLALRTRDLDIKEKNVNGNLELRQQQVTLNAEQRAEQTRQFRIKNNLSLAQFKAMLDEKVTAGKITQEQADQALRDAQ